MELNDINTRDDVHYLVTTFYAKVRKDDLLGPVFEKVITDWDHHFDHLTDFWESQLFMKNVFRGNPMKKHKEVDQQVDHNITELHFGVWLNYWFETIEMLFSGERADLAKNKARNMGSYLHMEMFKARP